MAKRAGQSKDFERKVYTDLSGHKWIISDESVFPKDKGGKVRYPKAFQNAVARHYLESNESYNSLAKLAHIYCEVNIRRWVVNFKNEHEYAKVERRLKQYRTLVHTWI